MNTCKDCKHYSQHSCLNQKFVAWLGTINVPDIGPDGGCNYFEKKEKPCCGNCGRYISVYRTELSGLCKINTEIEVPDGSIIWKYIEVKRDWTCPRHVLINQTF